MNLTSDVTLKVLFIDQKGKHINFNDTVCCCTCAQGGRTRLPTPDKPGRFVFLGGVIQCEKSRSLNSKVSLN